jgi:hypothetical protein
MKAITLTQPWASLVAIGAKTIETRDWQTSYRGPLAIHAGAGLGPVGGRTGLRKTISQREIGEALIAGGVRWETDLPLGAIVAVATLAGVWPMIYGHDAAGRGGYGYQTWETGGLSMRFVAVSDQEQAFGLWLVGRRAWVLTDVQRLEAPIPCTGRLGLWDVPPAIQAQLAPARSARWEDDEPARSSDAEDRYNRGGW